MLNRLSRSWRRLRAAVESVSPDIQLRRRRRAVLECLEPRQLLSYAVADYFPMSGGNTWEYSGSNNGLDSTAIITSSGITNITFAASTTTPSAGITPVDYTLSRIFDFDATDGLLQLSRDLSIPTSNLWSYEDFTPYLQMLAPVVDITQSNVTTATDTAIVVSGLTFGPSQSDPFTPASLEWFVVAEETVTTPAGTFQTIHVTFNELSSVVFIEDLGFEYDYSSVEDWWLASGIGIVQWNLSATINGPSGTTDTVYSAFSLTDTSLIVRPSNNNFASSVTLTGTSKSVTGNNINATAETNEPNHAGFVASHSVWWDWTPAQSGTATIDTTGTSFGNTLAVYTGSTLSTLTSIASSSSSIGAAKVVFNATAGTKYMIAVDSRSTATGSIALKLTEIVPVNIGFAVTGDFNNDGKDEVAYRDDKGIWWVSSNSGNKTLWGGWSTAVTWTDVMAADVNGDGRTDIVGRLTTGQWYVAVSDGTRFTNSIFGVWNPAVTWRNVMAADMNGDGRDDIVGQSTAGGWYAAIASASGIGSTNKFLTAWSTGVTWLNVHTGKFDDNSAADIVGFAKETGGWFVSKNNGTTLTTTRLGGWSPVEWKFMLVGDFNGDGLTDVAGNYVGYWYIGLTGPTALTTRYMGFQTPTNLVDVRPADINGDGKTDIISRRSDTGQWYMELTKFDTSEFILQPIAKWSASVAWSHVQVGNFDGDSGGKMDILGLAGTTGVWYIGASTGTTLTTSVFAPK